MWTLPVFVFVGGAACLALVDLSRSYGQPGAAGVVLLAFVAICMLPVAAAQACQGFRELAKQLRWWHGLWLLLFVSALVFRGRELQDIKETPVDAWAAFRITLVAITGLVLFVRLVLRKTNWLPSLFQGLVGALAIYSLVCGLSTIWSVYPAWTLYKSVEYLIDVSVIAAILVAARSLSGWKSLFDWTWLMYGVILLNVWLGAILWPGLAFIEGSDLLPFRLAGVLPSIDQNSVGEYAAALAIVAIARLLFLSRERGGRAFYGGLLVFGLVTLVMSQTRSAVVGFLAGAALIFFFARRRGMLTAFIVTAVLLLCFTTAGKVVGIYWQRNERTQEMETYSGRLPHWQAALALAGKRPLTGYGAYAGGRFAVLTSNDEAGMSSVLNSYVEVLVGTGIIGLIPLLAALIGTWWVLIRALRRAIAGSLGQQLALEALGVLALVTVRSVFTSHLVWHPALLFLVPLGYAELLRRARSVPLRAASQARPALRSSVGS
jgi:O-antigen ligase